MAASVRFLYPPNWDGNPPDRKGWDRIVVQFIGNANTADESYVQKIDISELRTPTGDVPTRTALRSVSCSAYNIDAIVLYWDRNPKEVQVVLAGGGAGGWFMKSGGGGGGIDMSSFGGIVDPGQAGDGTGDILLSTTMSAGATYGYYDIIAEYKLMKD